MQAIAISQWVGVGVTTLTTSTWPSSVAVVVKGARADLGRNTLGGLQLHIDDAHQLASGNSGVFLGMKAPQIADANDCRSDFFHAAAIMPKLMYAGLKR